MTGAVLPRRAFLGSLARLPLIGGAVSLIGAPTGVAEPVTIEALLAYSDWLFYERRVLCYEISGIDNLPARVPRPKLLEDFYGFSDIDYHWSPGGWTNLPLPSSRAALVLSTVGCDWRSDPGTRKATALQID